VNKNLYYLRFIQRTTASIMESGWRATVLMAFSLLLVAGCGEKPAPKGDGPAAKTAEVVAGEHSDKDGLKLSPEELQRAGIKVEALEPQAFNDALTVTATIRPNQDRLARVAPRVEGRIVGVSE